MKDLINAVGELLKEVLKVVLLGDDPPLNAPNTNTHEKASD